VTWRVKIVIAVFAMAAIGAVLWSNRDAPNASLSTIANGEKEGPGPGLAANIGDHGRLEERSTDLPPSDAPLAAIIGPLAARADSGDAKAACRLAMELIRCETVISYESAPGMSDPTYELLLEAEGNLVGADQVAIERIDRLERLPACRDIPPELRARTGHYLRQAALAGVPEAMLRYAEGHHWRADGRGMYAGAQFDQWRREAPALVRRAFAAGVPEAPMALWMAYQSETYPLGALIPDDPVQAEAMRMLMMRLHGWSERLVPSPLDGASLARAMDLSRSWHEKQFSSERYQGQDRSMFQWAGTRKRGGEPHRFCEGDAVVP
jgi:hypothetical protein